MNNLVEKITEKIISKLETRRKKILVALFGSNQNINEISAYIRTLEKKGEIMVVFSPHGKYLLEEKFNYLKILEKLDDLKLIDFLNEIHAPNLTLNSASKLCELMGDNLALSFLVQGIIRKKKIVVAKNGLYCCIPPEKFPSEISAKIKNIISCLERFGIKIIDIEQASKITNSTCAQDKGECIGCGQCILKNPNGVSNILHMGADRISSSLGCIGGKKIARFIDHTLLKPDATPEAIKKLCAEAIKYNFASVCVNPTNVAQASELLRGSNVKVCTVVGFPLGATTTTTKVIETRDAIANGAEEIDMVINVGALKSGKDNLVLDDIKAVVDAAKGKAIVKVILETALLSKEEKVKACLLAKMAGADFVKTSTGFGPGGATVEDIKIMRATVGPEMGVKASGGIRNIETALAMIKAGATRIGASASVAIVKGS
jgi:deoxyribose-phosphate aldolase